MKLAIETKIGRVLVAKCRDREGYMFMLDDYCQQFEHGGEIGRYLHLPSMDALLQGIAKNEIRSVPDHSEKRNPFVWRALFLACLVFWVVMFSFVLSVVY